MKLRLWKQYEHDRDAYTDAKTDFISKWTAEARKEYGDRYRHLISTRKNDYTDYGCISHWKNASAHACSKNTNIRVYVDRSPENGSDPCSGNTELTPEDDEALTANLWLIIRRSWRTLIENKQNLIIEGCYIYPSLRRDLMSDIYSRFNLSVPL